MGCSVAYIMNEDYSQKKDLLLDNNVNANQIECSFPQQVL